LIVKFSPIQDYNEPRVEVNRVQPEVNIPLFEAQEPIIDTNFNTYKILMRIGKRFLKKLRHINKHGVEMNHHGIMRKKQKIVLNSIPEP